METHEYYVRGFLNLDTKTALILKGQKIGYDVSFSEMGAGTFVTFTVL